MFAPCLIRVVRGTSGDCSKGEDGRDKTRSGRAVLVGGPRANWAMANSGIPASVEIRNPAAAGRWDV